jgi:transporter family protein
MDSWLAYSALALLCYGVVGLLQKIATNRASADTALLWYSIGYLALLPAFLKGADFSQVPARFLIIGVLAGLTARLGEWFLFASLRAGAKSSVAIPLTSTYPLLTLLLAVAFLHESLTPKQWVGITLALIAGVLMSYEEPGAKT